LYHSHVSTAGEKNAWSYSSASSYALMACTDSAWRFRSADNVHKALSLTHILSAPSAGRLRSANLNAFSLLLFLLVIYFCTFSPLFSSIFISFCSLLLFLCIVFLLFIISFYVCFLPWLFFDTFWSTFAPTNLAAKL